jgi:hypothetical protein
MSSEKRILVRKPYGPHDPHLEVVLAENEKGEFVTWLYNKEFKGYGHGHYFTSIAKAAADFEARGVQK